MMRSRLLTYPHPGNFLIQSVIELADWQLSRITQECLNSKRPSSGGHNPNLNHLVDIASNKISSYSAGTCHSFQVQPGL